MTADNQNDLPGFIRRGINLASLQLGAKPVFSTDEFFAPLVRMLEDANAVFIADKYDENGKWMDGWETRRRRNGGHDHAIIELAAPGIIFGFDIDTSHFTGNFPPAARIEGCLSNTTPDDTTQWVEIQPTTSLGADAHHYFEVETGDVFSHLRLHIYPDGGIARLRVYGQPLINPDLDKSDFELTASLNGGRIIAFSDAHYGSYHRLLGPGRGLDMGDGWETRRRREPGHDWIIIALATRGDIKRAIVDTAFYKGNFPDRCSIQATNLEDIPSDFTDAVVTSSMFWETLLPEQKLSADAVHDFSSALEAIGPVTHVRLNIFPDGGISRLKLFGEIE